MPMPTAAEYFDRMREQEHALRHTLPPLTKLDLYRLPATVQQLARLLGLPAVLDLVTSLGGITLRIPHGETPQGRAMLDMLAKHVGVEGAKVLAQEYGAAQLYIPICRQALIEARDAALLRDRETLAAEGLSERDIVACLAIRYATCDRNVWKILKKPAPIPETVQEQASLL